MRDLLLPHHHFPFLHRIIQEKVNQDGVNLRIWMTSEDLSSE
jgi:hypothetical protein